MKLRNPLTLIQGHVSMPYIIAFWKMKTVRKRHNELVFLAKKNDWFFGLD